MVASSVDGLDRSWLVYFFLFRRLWMAGWLVYCGWLAYWLAGYLLFPSCFPLSILPFVCLNISVYACLFLSCWVTNYTFLIFTYASVSPSVQPANVHMSSRLCNCLLECLISHHKPIYHLPYLAAFSSQPYVSLWPCLPVCLYVAVSGRRKVCQTG